MGPDARSSTEGQDMTTWDEHLPARRYAIFTDLIRGNYAIVVKGDDSARADKWGGFVSWLGGLKPAETRVTHKQEAKS